MRVALQFAIRLVFLDKPKCHTRKENYVDVVTLTFDYVRTYLSAVQVAFCGSYTFNGFKDRKVTPLLIIAHFESEHYVAL